MKKTKKIILSSEIMHSLEKNKDILLKYKVKRIGLFGSYVRGEQRRRSDIDFLVEFREPSFDNFMELAFYLEKLFGRKIELITNKNLNPHIRSYVMKEVQWYEA